MLLVYCWSLLESIYQSIIQILNLNQINIMFQATAFFYFQDTIWIVLFPNNRWHYNTENAQMSQKTIQPILSINTF